MRRTRKSASAVREQLIGALLPDVHAEPPPHSPAPLPTLPAPALPTAGGDDLLVGMARIDRSGRLHERRLLRALGWSPGQHLALDIVHGLIIMHAASAGPHVLDHRGALHLPAAARRMCGISADPLVVLAASVPEKTLVIHPAEVVAPGSGSRFHPRAVRRPRPRRHHGQLDRARNLRHRGQRPTRRGPAMDRLAALPHSAWPMGTPRGDRRRRRVPRRRRGIVRHRADHRRGRWHDDHVLTGDVRALGFAGCTLPLWKH